MDRTRIVPAKDVLGRVWNEVRKENVWELEESAYWFELLVEGEIVAAAKLQTLRGECDELTAIFVTIIKRARDPA